MENYSEIPAHKLALRIKSGEVSAEDVARHALDLIEEKNSTIHAYISVQEESVIEDARAVDRRIAVSYTHLRAHET